MAAKKIILVVGATGTQGGSVANTFLHLPNWQVRALTRNTASENAQKLAMEGAELVQGDLKDASSLTKAFEGVNAVFLNTEFWSIYYPAKTALEAEGKDPEPASHQSFQYETDNGKNVVDIAAGVPTLERFVYSALSPIAKGSKGKYTRSLHSEAKSWIVEYIEQEHPELAKKTSIIYPGIYNVNRMLSPRLDPNSGKYSFMLPVNKDTLLPIIDPTRSMGPFVRALVEDEKPGVKLLAYDSNLEAGQIVEEWSKASGKDAIFVPISVQAMHDKMKLPWELLDAPAYLAEFGYTAGIDGIIEPSQLTTKVETDSFEKWLQGRNWEEVLAS